MTEELSIGDVCKVVKRADAFHIIGTVVKVIGYATYYQNVLVVVIDGDRSCPAATPSTTWWLSMNALERVEVNK